MNLKNKRFLIPIIILVVTAVLCIVYFTTPFSSIGNSYSSYEKSIENNINNITNANKKIVSIKSEEHINTDIASKELNSVIDSLSKENELLVKLTPSKKYSDVHNDLLHGLNYNILLYKQMTLILKNTAAKDLDDSIANLKKYKKEIIDNYNKVKIKKLTIALPKESIDVVDNFIFYTEELIKINKQTELLKNQNKDFINKMEGILDSFNDIKTNFSKYLSSKEKSKSYNDVLTNVNKSMLDLENLMIRFGDVSVPEKAKDITKEFNETLLNYNTYLQNIKNNIKKQKINSSKDNPTITNLDKFNSSDYKDLEAVATTFSTFKENYNKYKKAI